MVLHYYQHQTLLLLIVDQKFLY
ncbi:hypothetical protein BLA29_014838 [Euroglyphus maynei]|uniref:Uncharacterized protein n=1 Tax=Euroglyphus maynei TaxID=6958 RepID=A0A1Y3BAI8_EURMA|nr:hypothetical protein BLA29_014838 [Euroglyphus maynei]